MGKADDEDVAQYVVTESKHTEDQQQAEIKEETPITEESTNG